MTSAEHDAEITVVLSASTAVDSTHEATLRGRVARDLGLTIDPQHPGSHDPELQRYYTGRVGAADAESLVDRLLALPGVDGAYVKPAGQPPM